jgi:hypothetical protein
MNGFDFGILINALRATIPTRKLGEFDELMYRGAMSSEASDALRWALGVDRARAQLRKFEVINGGNAA